MNSADEIAACFINYFAELFSSFHGTNDSHIASSEEVIQYDSLLSAPSKEEIVSILKTMRANAAPGPHGLNVTF